MNNNILSPQQLQAITQSLLQQLPANAAGNLRTLLQRAIVNSFTAPPSTPEQYIPNTTLSTPVGTVVAVTGRNDEDGTPLLRQSSTSSVSSSSSSNSSVSSTHDWEDGEDDYLIKRRRPANAQLKADKRIVTAPVMAEIDSEYLALHPLVRNSLFRRKFKRLRGPNGERKLKKNKDIVIPVFKQLVGPVLKRLTLRHLRSEQAVDPAVSYNILWRRFYYAALQVTKKRRANHIQSWRGEVAGTHKPLIYSGAHQRDDFTPTAVAPPPASPAAPTTPTTPAPATPAISAPVATAAAVPAPTTPAPVATAAAVPAPTTPAPTTPAIPTLAPQASDVADDVDFPVVCCQCDKELKKEEQFPKGDAWGAQSYKVWCVICWEKQSQQMVRSHIEDPAKCDEKLRELARKRPADKVNKKQTPRRKRQATKQCKWCGSTSHKRKTSKACPHNPKYVAPAIPPPADETVTPAETVTTAAPVPSVSPTDTAPPPSTADAVAPDTSSAPNFSVGDNVFVKVKKKKFLAQVVKILDDGDYQVYFVDDGEEGFYHRDDLSEERFPTPKRRDFLNLEFFYDGDDDLPSGRWKVRRIVKNEFVCTRLTGGTTSSTNVERFDIGYVMREIKAQREFRQNGRDVYRNRFSTRI